MDQDMTDRERLAVDLRRLEWLADARLGPARITVSPAYPRSDARSRAVFPIGLWRRGLSSALVFGQRLQLVWPGTELRPKRAPAPLRS